MIDFIIGDIVDAQEDFVIIQNNGIGYKVFTSTNSLVEIEVGGKEQMLYTQLFFREDGLYLYGFTSMEEMDMFNLLLRVSKIGPKIGIGVLSTLKSLQIKRAILNKDIQTLCKAPGIGKKTAERIIVELKDRIYIDSELEAKDTIVQEISEYNEAIDGLLSLGYSRYEIEKVIKTLNYKNMSVEEIIKEGLKKMSRN